MAFADITHGGFYKHFPPKADLLAESEACSFAQAVTNAQSVDAAAVVKHYLSRQYRDARFTGCTIAALV